MSRLPTLRQLYRRLFDRYGPQGWWPAETPFEVMVGAVLTQNAAWSNVERAIANLKAVDLLDPEAILALDPQRLAELIRPSGYFNVKARRLAALCRWFVERGGLGPLGVMETGPLREALLSVKGVGPETADDILLYAFHRPVFVVDAYTRRLFSRVGHDVGDHPYDILRLWIEARVPREVKVYNEYHALIVRHAKEHCRKRPLCEGCPLEKACRFAGRNA